MTPGESLGPYRLVARIAHGAMGEVWEAEAVGTPLPGEIKIGDRVALKLIPEYLAGDEAIVERLRREATAVGRLRHPGVVRLYEVREADGRIFLAMELLRGETLAARIERESPLPIAELESLAEGLADALAYVHAQGVIHRDLKPQNIVLTESGPKLIDLGVAKILDEVSMTMTGSHFGTPGYMSPESFLDVKRVGPAADVWAVGVILYQCATGRLPFPGASAASIIAKIMDTNVTPQAPALVRPELPPAIVAAIGRCVERDQAKRPQDGAALYQLLTGRTMKSAGKERGWLRAIGASMGTRPYANLSGEPARSLPLLGALVASLVAVSLNIWLARFFGSLALGATGALLINRLVGVGKALNATEGPRPDWTMRQHRNFQALAVGASILAGIAFVVFLTKQTGLDQILEGICIGLIAALPVGVWAHRTALRLFSEYRERCELHGRVENLLPDRIPMLGLFACFFPPAALCWAEVFHMQDDTRSALMGAALLVWIGVWLVSLTWAVIYSGRKTGLPLALASIGAIAPAIIAGDFFVQSMVFRTFSNNLTRDFVFGPLWMELVHRLALRRSTVSRPARVFECVIGLALGAGLVVQILGLGIIFLSISGHWVWMMSLAVAGFLILLPVAEPLLAGKSSLPARAGRTLIWSSLPVTFAAVLFVALLLPKVPQDEKSLRAFFSRTWSAEAMAAEETKVVLLGRNIPLSLAIAPMPVSDYNHSQSHSSSEDLDTLVFREIAGRNVAIGLLPAGPDRIALYIDRGNDSFPFDDTPFVTNLRRENDWTDGDGNPSPQQIAEWRHVPIGDSGMFFNIELRQRQGDTARANALQYSPDFIWIGRVSGAGGKMEVIIIDDASGSFDFGDHWFLRVPGSGDFDKSNSAPLDLAVSWGNNNLSLERYGETGVAVRLEDRDGHEYMEINGYQGFSAGKDEVGYRAITLRQNAGSITVRGWGIPVSIAPVDSTRRSPRLIVGSREYLLVGDSTALDGSLQWKKVFLTEAGPTYDVTFAPGSNRLLFHARQGLGANVSLLNRSVRIIIVDGDGIEGISTGDFWRIHDPSGSADRSLTPLDQPIIVGGRAVRFRLAANGQIALRVEK